MASLTEGIAVVGWSCRVPGADSVCRLWTLLSDGQCAVTSIPPNRFSLPHFGHPRKGERGRSYTWAAGVLDDIWAFDPGIFGISPREAQQMDPQQRILLELTWEAFEDAGIPPSALAGTDVGVFIGGSLSEHAHPMYGDPSIADSHFATGNALAILANRISYIFDLRGPSITVDTACSSSLVALHQAVQAIESGRIETAIVGGINVMTAPTSFISFAQASMLSPTGLCRAFSADADGYVRAEGGGIVILRKIALAERQMNSIHGIIVACDVNSDGRTNGISLPSEEAQQALLRRVYERAEISPERLAFVEAHGTGTPAGDPVEAAALGNALGRRRPAPLPIGSIKTNIGHLEPASGLAGLIKSVLALNNGILPASLHFSAPNPNIDFDALNLRVCREPLKLANAHQQLAGVNSFGFGGTNAHLIVAPGHKRIGTSEQPSRSDRFFSFSAASRPALVELARQYRAQVADLADPAAAAIASAAAHRRAWLSNRLVVTTTRRAEVSAALDAFIGGDAHDLLAVGEAAGSELPIAFVYSGNGSQWKGMGRAAYRNNAAFRSRFDLIEHEFARLAGWSLREAIFDETVNGRLDLTSVAQPLIFAVQSAATFALRERGLNPSAILGHSVGEVAAAEAAGIVGLPDAVRIVYFRSTHQELVRKTGRMAAVLAASEAVNGLVARFKHIEIAAYNSPRAVTIAGPADSLAQFAEAAKQQALVCLDLDLDYPFHTALMAPVEASLVRDLKDLNPRVGAIPFFSTVTGACLSGECLDATYWWRNVRQPVRFMAAVREAAKLGARFFVEIGPRGVLTKHMSDAVSGDVSPFAALSALERDETDSVDPFDNAVAKALVGGAKIDLTAIAGSDPGGSIPLPSYPWQRKTFRWHATPEAVGWFQGENHPLSGARNDEDALEWHAQIDVWRLPELADHRLAEQVILPGTGFIEIALSVARQWLGSDNITLTDFETLAPLDLTGGESREVMTRLSSDSRTFEIFGRPRLLQSGWILHARGKIVAAAQMAAEHPKLPPGGQPVSREALYRIADATGLHYGPAFAQITNLTRHANGLIGVELAPSAAATPFLLDPMRLDCCSQGLILLFAELHADERGVAYIPVRLDEVTLHAAGRIPQRSVIEVLSQDERSILANLHILASDDTLIATLRGVRCQAVPVRRSIALQSVTLVERTEPVDGSILDRSGTSMGADAILARARAPMTTTPGSDVDSTPLLDGWATMVAYEVASAFADRNILNPDALVEAHRISNELRGWLIMLLTKLTAAELASREDAAWTLIEDPLLPSSASVIKELAARHPELAGKLLVAAEITGLVPRLPHERGLGSTCETLLSRVALNFYDLGARSAVEAERVLMRVLDSAPELWPRDRAVRVLQIGFGMLASELVSRRRGNVVLTIFESDRRRFDRAKASLAKSGSLRLVEKLDPGPYDLIVAAEALQRTPAMATLAELREALAPRGLMVAVEPQPSFFKELVSGLRTEVPSAQAERGPTQPQTTEEWSAALQAAGFEDLGVAEVACGEGTAALLVGKAGDPGARERGAGARMLSIRIVSDTNKAAAELADALRMRLIRSKSNREVQISTVENIGLWDPLPSTIVQIISPDPDADNLAALTRACLDIKACGERLGSAPATLWLLFRGATLRPESPLAPVQSGAWAFSRTLANELQHLDVRRIDIASDLSVGAAVEHVAAIIQSGTAETELQIDGAVIRAVRVREIADCYQPMARPAPAARLERQVGAADRLAWQPAERRLPEANEIEIAVAATGLNFRDVMYTLGLLPDDILEEGFTGPTLGLECAGTVVAVGGAVETFNVGDPVVALALHAFSTHVTVSSGQVAKLPAGMSLEAGATIPTAFITAYYSLINLGQLKRDEWVLIHAGAGAVGMAAIQIAQAQGARVIATAGADAKRDLLRAFDVIHVLDSRSTRFVEDVRAITSAGVDVVLNSLAGDAMERSLACLRPFGRFIELGKRDYVANTHIGLRPFRRNLSYFGVDIDQLMASRPSIGTEVFRVIMGAIEDATLTPLPYSMFGPAEVPAAFHLMQQAGHIGKIVVRPPDPATIRVPGTAFKVNPAGTHIVTGGLGGFGLATAKWLADRGARHLVLVGRRGVASEDAKDLVTALRRRGVNVLAQPCDVADATQVKALFEKIGRTMPPIAGIIHCAMVLDDTIIANLTAERFDTVLAPKVRGADLLDRATCGLHLDYFVLFSSVVTLIGNRGQGSYVAANAYLEALARRRRKAGLPALAIGWGPITDVGVVARTERMRTDLRKIGGVHGMTAREALDLMAQALGETADDPGLAAITIAPHEAAFSADLLPILKSPTYQTLVTAQGSASQELMDKIDLRSLMSTQDIGSVRDLVGQILVIQLSRVLFLDKEDVSRIRPLSEMGLDSLMALELALKLESIFGIQLSFARSASNITLNNLVDEIITLAASKAETGGDTTVTRIVEHHIAEVDPGQIEIVSELLREGRRTFGGMGSELQEFTAG
jgi:phthiocerol/phenolphthiocerol synthesis type-I polyketide synthase C